MPSGCSRPATLSTGYLQAKVDWAVSPVAGQDASELVFTVQSGPRARIGKIEVTGQPLQSARDLLHDLDIATGEPFDGPALERRRERVMRAMRTRGYYEANVHAVRSSRVSDGVIDLTIDVEPGPFVTLRFVGDPIDQDRRVELVPVAREASVDEDLLEDSKRRIERYLHDLGHWKAAVDYRREGDGNRLDLVFEIRAGEVFRIARVDVEGAQAIPAAEIDTLLATKPGDLYVETALDARTAALVERYRREGYPSVRIEQTVEEVVQEQGGEQKAGVNLRLRVEEGPHMGVGDVRLTGNRLVPEGELRERLQLRPGVAYYEPLVATDRDALQNAYLDRGFDRARVEPSTTFENGSGRAIVTHTIVEGPQIVVDRILIVGNRRTSTETIERALTLKPGDPLGLSQLVESQRRLRALGLFTRVTMTDVGDPGATRRDLLVNVEEAPPTTISYGGGVEAGRRLTTTGDDPAAREKFEIAGRGFFDIGRRNLFGSNRSVNLFLAVSLRPPDEPDPAAESDFGFNEYRVLATFREPSAFGTTADGQLVGYFEQAIRSSFNFVRRGIQAEVSKRTRARTNLIGGYSLSEVRLYDERIAPEDRPDIDRLFPQVRLSKFSGAARRDLRDDVLDPTRGTVIGLSADTAARAIGSQVGFVKGFAEVFGYRQVPPLGRVVLAGGARLGLARGLTREAVREDEKGNPVIGPDGQPIVEEVADLPASERFFAGGDTTVRGFARDSLGDVATLDPNGFPTGGNAVIILNGELRAPLWRQLGGVVFVDVGNVFRRVTDIELSALRASAGFGLRYKSPVGPVRFDLGLKLDPQELVPGRRESRYALHFSIGQAF